MTQTTIRSLVERREAAEAVLATEPQAYVSTASPAGRAHMVPLCIARIDGELVVCTPRTSVTARNLPAGAHVRIGFGTTMEPVLVDATVARRFGVREAADDYLDRFAAQARWDARAAGDGCDLIVFELRRVQAWGLGDEIRQPFLMRGGDWLA